MKPECGKCKFYGESILKDGTGRCRINPPQTEKVNHDSYGSWPIVDESDWCGQFELRAPE